MAVAPTTPDRDGERFRDISRLAQEMEADREIIESQSDLISQKRKSIDTLQQELGKSEAIMRNAQKRIKLNEDSIRVLVTPPTERDTIPKAESLESPTNHGRTIKTNETASSDMSDSRSTQPELQSAASDVITVVLYPKLSDPQWLQKAENAAIRDPSSGCHTKILQHSELKTQRFIYAKTTRVTGWGDGVEYLIGSAGADTSANNNASRALSTLTSFDPRRKWQRRTIRGLEDFMQNEMLEVNGMGRVTVWFERHLVASTWKCDNFWSA